MISAIFYGSSGPRRESVCGKDLIRTMNGKYYSAHVRMELFEGDEITALNHAKPHACETVLNTMAIETSDVIDLEIA